MSAMKITHAYCMELKRVLSITDARREFFSLDEPRTRFEFICSSEACQKKGIKITAVNYDKLPNDTYQESYFKRNHKHEHLPECDWEADDENDFPNEQLTDESESEAKQRHIKHKLNDYINAFDPRIGEPEADESALKSDISTSPSSNKQRKHKSQRQARLEKHRRTRSLERLVEYYRNARTELSKEELNSLTLHVTGEGNIPLPWYFKHLEYAKPGRENRVIHGGATQLEWYGIGFRLKFYSRIENKPVFLYVRKEQMEDYRLQPYIRGLLLQDNADYFDIYAIGSLTLSPTGKSISFTVDSLEHMVIIPVQKKKVPAPAED